MVLGRVRQDYYGHSPGADPLGATQTAIGCSVAGAGAATRSVLPVGDPGTGRAGYRIRDLGFRVARFQSSR